MASPADVELATQGRPQSRFQTFRESLLRASALSQRLPELPQLFPFRLGESVRDWALPYAFDDRIVALGSFAIEELFDLIAERRQPDSGLAPRYGLRRGLQPWAIRLAASASEMDPQLDAALIESWCDKSAGTLGEELTGAFTRALEAEVAANDAPPYGMLLAAAAPALVESLKGRIKSRSLKGMPYERLEKALGFALFALIELAAQRAMREIERRPGPRDTRPLFERIRLCLNPLLYCAIRSHALQNTLNPWWLSEELNEAWIPRRAEEILARPVDQSLQLALDQLLQDSAMRAKYAKAGRKARLRYELLRLLWEYDRGTEGPWGDARGAFTQEDRLVELQRSPRPFVHQLQQAGVSPRSLGPIQGLLGSASSAGNDLEDLQTALIAQLSFAIDRVIAEHLDRLAHGLRDVRGDGNVGVLIQLYEQGRLYRLSADQKPILHSATRRLSGYLFVDLKGFTQRTVRAKEIVVADFLRREFYEPILYAAGTLQLTGGGQAVQLLNLVGDAVAFAGQIPALVKLASQIRKLCAAYQKTLAKVDASSAANDEERVRREIQNRFAALEEPLSLEMSALEAELARKQAMSLEAREAELGRVLQSRAAELAQAHFRAREQIASVSSEERPALEAEMLRLSAAQEALAETSRTTLERLAPVPEAQRAGAIFELITERERQRLEALNRGLKQAREQAQRELQQRRRSHGSTQGAGMEAGVFISYGTAPEEISIQDAVFGEVRVSVGEKLNEAARGTGRSAKVAEEAAQALGVAVHRTGNPNLRDPFLVHLGGGAEAEGVATDIFNVGEALSQEALHVFLQQSAATRYHFERTVGRGELAPEIVDSLAVPDRFKLIVSMELDGPIGNALLFRHAGFVLFRGFEEGEGCEVYELLSGENRLVKLLAQHHLQRWAEEARANRKLLLTGLLGR